MIQRIQTIWLLICTIAIALTFKLEFFGGINELHPVFYKVAATETLLTVLLTTILIAVSITTIFLYKKRKLQIVICYVGIVLDIFLILIFYKEITKYKDYTISAWAILHAVIILCFLLAARSINKDEKLIKDSDRLR